MTTIRALARAKRRALTITDRLNFVAPLLARLTVGVVFVGTGWGKLHNLGKVTEFFTELNIPAPAFHARLVSSIELVCGALLLIGLATRFAALPLIGTMVVAIITAKASDIHGLSDLFGTVEFTYIALLVWIALSGPGAASLDRVLFGAAPRSSAPRELLSQPS